MGFIVSIDDNFHYQDESQRSKLGEFETYEEALVAAQDIVDRFLENAKSNYKNAIDLYSSYRMYGDDPFIYPDTREPGFSAWKYAEEKCQKLYKDTMDE
jgi:hypothetical protein